MVGKVAEEEGSKYFKFVHIRVSGDCGGGNYDVACWGKAKGHNISMEIKPECRHRGERGYKILSLR